MKMMSAAKATLGTLTLATLLAGSALADTSSTTVQATAPRLIDKLSLSYWGGYSGPSLSLMDRRTLNTSDGSLTDIQNLDSTFTGGYKLTPTTTLNYNARYIYTPMTAEGGQDITSHDHFVSLRNGKFLSVGGANMSADIRAYVPILNSDRMYTAFRSTQTTTYSIPNSRLTLGIFSLERVNLRKVSLERGPMPTVSLDVSPFANYQLTPTLSATAWVDALVVDYLESSGAVTSPVFTQVGVNWDITPNVSFNPTVNFHPSTVSMERATLGASLSAKLL